MLKIDELRDMTESEIKQFFKEVIMDQTEEFSSIPTSSSSS